MRAAPLCGPGRDPYHQLHHVRMMLLQGPVQDRLVVRDAVAKVSDPHQRRGKLFASKSTPNGVCRNPVQCLLP